MCEKLAPDQATQHMRQHNTHTKVKAFHWISHTVLLVLLCEGMKCEALPMHANAIAYRIPKGVALDIAYRISHTQYSIVNSQSYCFASLSECRQKHIALVLQATFRKSAQYVVAQLPKVRPGTVTIDLEVGHMSEGWASVDMCQDMLT